jgi:hypothetical protein
MKLEHLTAFLSKAYNVFTKLKIAIPIQNLPSFPYFENDRMVNYIC